MIYRYRCGAGVAGSTERVRAVADGVEAAPPVQSRTAPGTRSTRPCWPRPTRAGEVDWTVSVDSTINRAHQHATNLPREEAAPWRPRPESPAASPSACSGPHRGRVELQRSGVAGRWLRLGPWLPGAPLRRAGRPRHRTLSRRAVLQDPPARRRPRTTAGRRWSAPARPATPRCSPCCWASFASSGADRVGHAPRPTRCSATRPTPRAPTASDCCAPRDQGGDPRTRRPDPQPHGAAPAADDRRLRRPGLPRTATSSSAPSTPLKHWRGLATRYDKHAIVYRGAASYEPS